MGEVVLPEQQNVGFRHASSQPVRQASGTYFSYELSSYSFYNRLNNGRSVHKFNMAKSPPLFKMADNILETSIFNIVSLDEIAPFKSSYKDYGILAMRPNIGVYFSSLSYCLLKIVKTHGGVPISFFIAGRYVSKHF